MCLDSQLRIISSTQICATYSWHSSSDIITFPKHMFWSPHFQYHTSFTKYNTVSQPSKTPNPIPQLSVQRPDVMPNHIQSQILCVQHTSQPWYSQRLVGTKLDHDTFLLLLAQPSHDSGCQHIGQHLRISALGRAELPRIRHTWQPRVLLSPQTLYCSTHSVSNSAANTRR